MKKNYSRPNSLIYTVLLGLIFVFTLANPERAWGQKINLRLNNITVQEAIAVLSKSENYSIAIKSSVIDLQKIISVAISDATIEEALDKIFAGQDISYHIDGNSISVTQAPAPAPKAVQQAPAKPVPNDVSGGVFDKNGFPVIGAAVTSGTSHAVQTDFNGKFTLADITLPATLKISYLGYEPQTIVATDYKPLTITLREAETMLDDVVVVGYGTQRRGNLTGAVSAISGKELQNRPVTNAASVLQGADPSMYLTFNTGSPEAGYSLDIRGSVSLNGGEPLILVDGVEANLSQINPNDIESVTILKDASASAIYGAKASAGVVLITTRAGIKGEAKVNYSGRVGWAMNTTSTDFITTGYDQVVLSNRFYNSYNGVDMYLYNEANGGLQKLHERRNDKTEHPDRPWTEVGDDGKYYYYANFDWYDFYYNRTRKQQEHNISAAGGTDNLRYYASGRIYDQDGMFKVIQDNYRNYAFRTKVDVKIKKWLKYSNNINFDTSEYTYGGHNNYEGTILALQSNTPPAFLPYNPDGSIVQYTNQLYANSPIGAGRGGHMTAGTSHNSKGNKYLTVSNNLDIDITKDLVVTATYNYSQRNRLYKYRNNVFEYSSQEGDFKEFTSGSVMNSYQESRYEMYRNMANVYATYKHTWGGAHNFTAVAGGQYDTWNAKNTSLTQNDLSAKDLASFNIATGSITASQSINAYKTLGFFARVNYDYKGKYLFEASMRADGTSRFRKEDRWGYFPGVSAGWRVSEEEFFKPIKNTVNDLKIRVSAGSLGNQQSFHRPSKNSNASEQFYPYLETIGFDYATYTFDDVSLAKVASISDPASSALTWETIVTYNVGLDVAMFNNRLYMMADAYIRDTKNMLTTSITLPDVFGAATPFENCADMRTKGWELSLQWRDKFTAAGKPFSYNVTVGIGDNKATITKFNNDDKVLSDWYAGMTLGEIWGYRVDGLFKTDREAAQYQAMYDDTAVNQRVYNCKGADGNILRAGDVRFRDLDGDYVISAGSSTADNPGDMEIIGNSLPRYQYSFRVGFDWYGFDVSAFFQGVGKRDWYPLAGQNAMDFWGPYAFPSTSFIHKDFLTNGWTEDNRNAYFPRQRGYQAYAGGSLGTVNDRYMQDVSYLRFKNLTIGYTIPVLKKHIEKVRIFASGENLYYWSPFKKHSKNVDPELAVTSINSASSSGVGYAYSRVFSLSAEIVF